MFKRMPILFALGLALGLAGTAAAASAPGHASILIRHETHGCHAWSVNGGAFTAKHSITLRRGGWLTVTDNDVMSHRLVQTSGPALRIANATLKHMGATLKVTFTKPGVYHFQCDVHPDTMKGTVTVG